MYYVVIDRQRQGHFVEAESPGLALLKIPNGETVRLALAIEIAAHHGKKSKENKESKSKG